VLHEASDNMVWRQGIGEGSVVERGDTSRLDFGQLVADGAVR
jgi:hypothetical protein